MHTFQQHVGGGQQLHARSKSGNGGIVTDAGHDTGSGSSHSSNTGDEAEFAEGSKIFIIHGKRSSYAEADSLTSIIPSPHPAQANRHI